MCFLCAEAGSRLPPRSAARVPHRRPLLENLTDIEGDKLVHEIQPAAMPTFAVFFRRRRCRVCTGDVFSSWLPSRSDSRSSARPALYGGGRLGWPRHAFRRPSASGCTSPLLAVGGRHRPRVLLKDRFAGWESCERVPPGRRDGQRNGVGPCSSRRHWRGAARQARGPLKLSRTDGFSGIVASPPMPSYSASRRTTGSILAADVHVVGILHDGRQDTVAPALRQARSTAHWGARCRSSFGRTSSPASRDQVLAVARSAHPGRQGWSSLAWARAHAGRRELAGRSRMAARLGNAGRRPSRSPCRSPPGPRVELRTVAEGAPSSGAYRFTQIFSPAIASQGALASVGHRRGRQSSSPTRRRSWPSGRPWPRP